MLENNTIVHINGAQYRFCNRINEDKALLASFNELGTKTFNLHFDSVGGEYEPHTIVDGNTVCANISVNQVPFEYKGKQYLLIQLGTVMTRKEYRNRGLSRFLMEQILEKWAGHCDGIYLFGNDSVLEFYPKFGFIKKEESEYYQDDLSVICNTQKHVKVDHLDMAEKQSQSLVIEHYAKKNPYSEFFMVNNRMIFDFYAMRVMKDCMYTIPEYDVIVFAEYEEDTLFLHDIYGSSKASLKEIAAAMCRPSTTKVILGFTPKDKEGLISRRHKEEDCTFFLHRSSNLPWEDTMLFPIISHA